MKKIVVNIIVGILISAATVGITLLVQYYQDRTKPIYYSITETGNLLAGIADRADLRIETQPVKSIGSFEYRVFNDTGNDYGPIDVLITLRRSSDGKGTYIDSEFADVFGATDGRVRLISKDFQDKFFKFHVRIDPYNASDKPVMIGKIIVSDIEELKPEFSVSIQGFEHELLNELDPKKEFRMILIALLIVTLITFGLTAYLISLLRNRVFQLKDEVITLRTILYSNSTHQIIKDADRININNPFRQEGK
jgi:hypothetical protein